MSIGMCSGSAQGTQAHARPFDELHSRNHCQGGGIAPGALQCICHCAAADGVMASRGQLHKLQCSNCHDSHSARSIIT